MTIDRASVEEGARLAAEATPGPWTYDEVTDPDDGEWRWIEPSLTIDPESPALRKPNAAFIAHWNPEFAAEVVRELQRLWRVEEAARELHHFLANERETFDPGDELRKQGFVAVETSEDYDRLEKLTDTLGAALVSPAAEER